MRRTLSKFCRGCNPRTESWRPCQARTWSQRQSLDSVFFLQAPSLLINQSIVVNSSNPMVPCERWVQEFFSKKSASVMASHRPANQACGLLSRRAAASQTS